MREVQAARLLTSITEQLKQEELSRQNAENDFVEMECVLKKRVLYLEQYKAAVGGKMGRLQGRLDLSVPHADYLAMQDELESLREDHLIALRREVEASIAALNSLEQANDIRAFRLKVVQLESDLHNAQSSVKSLEGEISHQKEITHRTLTSANTPAEVSSIISEMARYRGESSRLEVEVLASKRRFDLLEEYSKTVEAEVEECRSRIRELQDREDNASAQESESRREAVALKASYEGGLRAAEAITLKAELETSRRELEASQMEGIRYKELAEISSLQAQSIGSFKQQHMDELTSLREYCAKLESQGGDELLIGKLQRQLMSTKTSYKAFVRKFQYLRGNMRQRELAMRVLETRLDERDAAVLSIQDTHRLEIAALKKSLRTLRNIASDDIEEHNPIGPSYKGVGSDRGCGTGKGKVNGKGMSVVKGILTGQRNMRGLLTFGDKLLSMSQKVNTLCILAEGAVAKAATAEEETMELKGVSQDLSAEKDLLLQRCADLEALNAGKNKQQTVASRLVALSEEVRTHKLAALQQRREIQVLRQEKKHLQNVLSTMEADVEDLEEGKVRAETKNLLMDITTSSSPEDGHAQRLDTGGGISLLGDTMDAYKKLRGGLMSLSGVEEDQGYEEKKANFAYTPTSFTSAVVATTETDDVLDHNNEVNALALSDIPSDLLIRKIQDMNDALSLSRRAAGESRLRGDRLQSSLNECETALREMERHVTHYEGVMAREGLPDIKGFQGSGADVTRHRGRQNLSSIDQENLQEAATATMASMKQLLEEKNKVIEKYREKLEDVKTNKKPKTAADRKADALLERLTQEPDTGSRSRMSTQGPGRGQIGDEEIISAQNRLLSQIEEADHILMDKDRTISQLEQRLSSQENQRERAEIRCGTALKEMEAMKGDMILLAQQLQISESKYTAHVQRQANERLPNMGGANHPSSLQSQSYPASYREGDAPELQYGDDTPPRPLAAAQDTKSAELQKIINAKNEKISGYREIIVRLKEEFIKLEEEKAVAAVINKDKTTKGKSNGKDSDGLGSKGREEGTGTIGEGAMRELRAQVVALRDGLRLAKEDLEKARNTREKLTRARQAAQEEVKQSILMLSLP